MSTCFGCSAEDATPRRSFAMKPSWYQTALPHRTICLCDECYTPDRQAGKRTDAVWERREAIWGELPEERDHGFFDWDAITRAYEEAA